MQGAIGLCFDLLRQPLPEFLIHARSPLRNLPISIKIAATLSPNFRTRFSDPMFPRGSLDPECCLELLGEVPHAEGMLRYRSCTFPLRPPQLRNGDCSGQYPTDFLGCVLPQYQPRLAVLEVGRSTGRMATNHCLS